MIKEVLNQHIERWEWLVSLAGSRRRKVIEDYGIAQAHMPLCKRYLFDALSGEPILDDTACTGCPVADYADDYLCLNTGYYDAYELFERWLHAGIDTELSEFYGLAAWRAFVEHLMFLKEVREHIGKVVTLRT